MVTSTRILGLTVMITGARLVVATLVFAVGASACSSDDGESSGGLFPSDATEDASADPWDTPDEGEPSSPSSDDPEYADVPFTMSGVPPEVGCSYTIASFGDAEPHVEEDAHLGSRAQDVEFSVCAPDSTVAQSEIHVGADMTTVAEVTGEQDVAGCVQALEEPTYSDVLLTDLEPGDGYCIWWEPGHLLYFLTLVEVDVPTYSLTWELTEWSGIDPPQSS